MSEVETLTIDPDAPCTLVQRQLAARFADNGSTAAMIEARLILCAALGIDHATLLRYGEYPIGSQGAEATTRLAALAARRAAHEPVSRILGRREFWGLDFAISPDVLDPRPDTETIVEAAIAAVGPRRAEALRILDLGVGSGAILGALLASFPNAYGIGVDVSEAACGIAAKNLETLKLASRSAVICADWTKPLAGPFDLIVSNPPYIAADVIETLEPEVRDYDPHLALDGGRDGYDAYRTLIPLLPRLLASDGAIVFEIGEGQGDGVARLFTSEGFDEVEMRPDLAGIDRAVIARRA
jgi:release factor glutamine methyltransferase